MGLQRVPTETSFNPDVGQFDIGFTPMSFYFIMIVKIKYKLYLVDEECNLQIPISGNDGLCKNSLEFLTEVQNMSSAEKINSTVIKLVKLLMSTPEDKLDQVINTLFD